jgi:hypothetical protein
MSTSKQNRSAPKIIDLEWADTDADGIQVYVECFSTFEFCPLGDQVLGSAFGNLGVIAPKFCPLALSVAEFRFDGFTDRYALTFSELLSELVFCRFTGE